MTHGRTPYSRYLRKRFPWAEAAKVVIWLKGRNDWVPVVRKQLIYSIKQNKYMKFLTGYWLNIEGYDYYLSDAGNVLRSR